MRLLGYELTRPSTSDVTTLFGGGPIPVPHDVQKADRTVNQGGTDLIRAIAAGQQTSMGSSDRAYGTRPTAGALPAATTDVEADPLRFQLPWGGNLTYTPRSGYGTPFSLLRNLATTSPAIAMCIQCRKDQMAALDWDFAPRDKKAAPAATEAQLARARQLFAKPDGIRSFKRWLQLLVDEVLTIDAVSIWRHPTRLGAIKQTKDPAYQLAPEEISSFDVIDGSTIKVLLDERGEIPRPPQVAYRQIAYGAPMTAGDLTVNQLMYRPKTERTWTPYGMSPIEAALLIVTADINRAMFNLSYYSEGNIPEALVGVPNTWSPKQIQQFNEYWDLVLKGDPKNRSKLRFVVETMAKTVHEFRKPDFTTQYDLWLLKTVCAMFGVTPSEIGFTDDVNKATSKTQGDVNQRRGVKPMASFLKSILDEMLGELGLADIETTWAGGEGEDALTQARITDLNIRNGRTQLDEQRVKDGLPALGLPPGVLTATGYVPFDGVSPAGDEHMDAPLDNEPVAAERRAEDLAITADLKKYRTVALKAVKSGRPVPTFESTVLPRRLHGRLASALTSVTTADDVQKIFGSVRKAQRLSKTQRQHRDRMKSTLTSLLAKERDAFAAHLATGLEAHA